MSLGLNYDYWTSSKAQHAKRMSQEFLHSPASRRYVFGRNVYSHAVASHIEIAAYIDDFTTETTSNDIPIVRTEDVPPDAVVLACSGGRPLTVRNLLRSRNLQQIDYFSFYKWSGLRLPEAVFNENFASIVDANKNSVDWVLSLLADTVSIETFHKLFAFRYSYDLDHLNGFIDRQKNQYFEPFLDLNKEHAVFVDVGGYDGCTAVEFGRVVPSYKSIYVFEPDKNNFISCRDRLAPMPRVNLLPYGAGETSSTLRFSSNGSASAIREDGEGEIEIRAIDDAISETPTYIKMDIEGSEMSALAGARSMISRHRPYLAVCVYHRPSDFWDVPRLVLDMCQSYKIYLRHYTESIYETVMYFVPAD